MKKLWSLMLCAAMLMAMFAMPASAATAAADAYNLDKIGFDQDHYYVGDPDTSVPNQDGTISTGEYTVSSESDVTLYDDTTAATPKNTTIGVSDVKYHFSYDADYIYMAVSMTDSNFDPTKNSHTFNFVFETAGGVIDICSRASVTVSFDGAEDSYKCSADYLDQHTGGTIANASYLFATERICESYVASYDEGEQKVVYEIKLIKDGLREEIGLIVDDRALFFGSLKNGAGHGWYRVDKNSGISAAMNAAVPEHKMGYGNWGAHVIHFCTKAAADAAPGNIHTLKGGSVRIYSAEDSGLRFATAFKKSYIDANRANITEIGTIIAIADYIDSVDSFKSLTPANEGVTYVKVKADLAKPYKYESDSYVYAGSVVKIKDTATEYAGIGYVVIGGQTYYSDTYSVRSAAGVAYAAIRDISKTNMVGYRCETFLRVGKEDTVKTLSASNAFAKVYTPYTVAEREILVDIASGYNTYAIGALIDLYTLEAKEAGNIRVVSSNVYFHEMNWVHGSKSSTAYTDNANVKAAIDRKANALLSTGADVLLLQEVSGGFSGTADYHMHTYLDPLLVSGGYTQVDSKGGNNVTINSSNGCTTTSGGSTAAKWNYTPIWYNSDTLELGDHGHCYYTSVSSTPDGKLSESKGFSYAVFTVKATGKSFVAISTHMTYHGDADTANILRIQDATELVDYINSNFSDKTVIIGGDFNCKKGSDPYEKIVGDANANLWHARDLADVVKNAHYKTSHTYLSSTNKTDIYLPHFSTSIIDNIFVTDTTSINVKEYQTIISDAFTQATDHVPVSIDFTLN